MSISNFKSDFKSNAGVAELRKEEDGGNYVLRLLESIGLSENESKVYKYLVENGSAVSRDLLTQLNLRQPQLYDIMASLERKQFINVQNSRPKVYLPVNTEVILENRTRDTEKIKKELMSWVSNSSRSMTSLPAMWLSRNWNSFVSNTSEIIRSARQTLFLETPVDITDNFSKALESKMDEGIRSGLLIFGTGMQDYRSKFLKRDSRLFSEIRIAGIGQFFSAISDMNSSSFMPRRVALSGEDERYGYILRDGNMSWFLLHNFFQEWFTAETVFSRPIELPAVYTIQRIAVSDMLRLMKEGLKNLYVRVTGKERKTGEDITVEGRVTDIDMDHDIVDFRIRSGTRDFTVGGYDSIAEDIEAETIELLRASGA
jgi:sugar-specific transcriptional regulator TrmB